jgi:hypothetical protein
MITIAMWMANRDVSPTASAGYYANSSVFSVHCVTLSASASWCAAGAGRADRLQAKQRNRPAPGSRNASGPQDLSYCAFESDLCQARVKPQLEASHACTGGGTNGIEQLEDADFPCSRAVLMSRGPAVMLGVIVVDLRVRMQQRRQAERRKQRRNELQRRHAVHRWSAWDGTRKVNRRPGSGSALGAGPA